MSLIENELKNADKEGFNDGISFAHIILCKCLSLDPSIIDWDSATETLEGDVESITMKILRAKFGEDWIK